ncbi:hypothetical protein [Nonomuraea rhodomycinica]|uniref:DUF998 domain-containing protein n=1 Tax=Nonomuraea rhodomycinica TaxID=1712872 RepID=A0A7Y6IW32_9ACTN|nr:hypothetical protein [Nonomuraea rhodomycinica]NUW45442.1 hypothetical protein [Nonomuraea rhodomycinica]
MTTTHQSPPLVRLAPAIGLLFLAPLDAEVLMGNFPITDVIGVVGFLVIGPLYGAGALFIREAVRRTGRGWPTMLAFALAYGMFEEAFITQTLWDENWVGVRILDYGYIPALGTALPWVLFMAGVHTIWSISVPIAIIETLAGPRGTTPWLKERGFRAVAVFFALYSVLAAVARAADIGLLAGPLQFAGAAVVVAALVVLGLRLRRAAPTTGGGAPAPWAVFAFALAAGAVFVLLYAIDPTGLSPWLAIPLPAWGSVLGYLTLFAAAGLLVRRWSHRSGWSDAHRLALAAGAMLTYAWHSFPWKPTMTVPISQTVDLTSNAIATAGAVVLLVIAARRVST